MLTAQQHLRATAPAAGVPPKALQRLPCGDTCQPSTWATATALHPRQGSWQRVSVNTRSFRLPIAMWQPLPPIGGFLLRLVNEVH